ncbi:hypothetical protein OUZ56_031652 [Daphnia magna]|uniref:Uncharacterized protein n=1 Tax=Daphnia magna TaxID=35525 RepID=A0ABQ9ZVW0_9CRUS|nr:hypothetical protein OUZ56_031652 [Daphnia magna]
MDEARIIWLSTWRRKSLYQLEFVSCVSIDATDKYNSPAAPASSHCTLLEFDYQVFFWRGNRDILLRRKLTLPDIHVLRKADYSSQSSDISSSIFDRELRDIKNGFQSVGHPFGSCRLEPGRPQFRSALL